MNTVVVSQSIRVESSSHGRSLCFRPSRDASKHNLATLAAAVNSARHGACAGATSTCCVMSFHGPPNLTLALPSQPPPALTDSQGNEVYGGAETSAGIFLHRSSDDAIVKGDQLSAKESSSPCTTLWTNASAYFVPLPRATKFCIRFNW